MSFRLYANNADITEIAGNLAWSSDADTLGQELNFKMPFDKDGVLLPPPLISVGDKISLKYNGNDVFFGVVVDEERNGRSAIHYNCFDLAFYLNKNKITIQFNGIPANQAIQKLCEKVNISCSVSSMSVKIKKIYKSQLVSEILKDILQIAEEQSGIKYRFEMNGSTLTVFPWRDIYVTANVEWISNPTRKLSISEMRNKIEIVSDDEKMIQVLATAEDGGSISRYGLLTHSQPIDEKEKQKAKTVADNLLNEMNKISEDTTVSLLGNYEVRAGRVITINEPITGISGDYLIKNASHTFENGIHKMNLQLDVK